MLLTELLLRGHLVTSGLGGAGRGAGRGAESGASLLMPSLAGKRSTGVAHPHPKDPQVQPQPSRPSRWQVPGGEQQ